MIHFLQIYSSKLDEFAFFPMSLTFLSFFPKFWGVGGICNQLIWRGGGVQVPTGLFPLSVPLQSALALFRFLERYPSYLIRG